MGILFGSLSVFFFVVLLGRVLAQAAARLRDRYEVRDAAEFGDLLLVLEPRAARLAGASLGTIAAILALPTLGIPAAMASFLAAVFGIPALVARHQQRWRAALETQLAEGLTTVGAGLRAGLSLQRAFEQLAEEAPRPLGRELAVVVRQCKLGVSLDEALEELAERARSEDVDLVVVSIAVARRFGGNLSTMLDRVASTARERIRIGGKIRALTAQGRMQAWIVAALPLGLALAMAALRPDLMEPMLGEPLGLGILAAVGLMEVLGLWLIRRIVSIRI